jgi:hypothetical protein
VPKCESCKCTKGAGRYCGDQRPDYLEGIDCNTDNLYDCITKDNIAVSVNHCLHGCLHNDPGHANCIII